MKEIINKLSKEEKYAYEMGKDCKLNGANEKNCNFKIFSSPSMTRAWELGNKRSPTS